MIRIIFPLIFSIAALISGNAAAQQMQSAQAAVKPPEIADSAPDTYTVVRGDTLWSISGRFLKERWRWPEVWRMNKAQIRNPHLIYPGQVIILDRSGPYLSIGRPIGGSGRSGSGKLEPQVYTEKMDTAIPSIPLSSLGPFMTQPMVSETPQLPDPGTVIATEHSRLYTGMGDTIYAKNISDGEDVWDVFRAPKPLVDPITNEKFGYEAQYLGSAKVVQRDDATELEILNAVEEIGVDDLLLPREQPELITYVPHAPEYEIEGRVISMHNAVAETGRYHVVALNVGSNDGIDVGTVLALQRYRGIIEHKEGVTKEKFKLPEKVYGLVFVFRVFERVSYALVMETVGMVSPGDVVRKP